MKLVMKYRKICNKLFIVMPEPELILIACDILEVQQLDTEHLYFMLSESDLLMGKDSLKSARMVQK